MQEPFKLPSKKQGETYFYFYLDFLEYSPVHLWDVRDKTTTK